MAEGPRLDSVALPISVKLIGEAAEEIYILYLNNWGVPENMLAALHVVRYFS